MDRVIVFSHEDAFLFELSESEVYELRRHEEINGEHYLTITTTTVLQKEQRILTQDATGKWYEWVVTTEDMEHAGGRFMVGTYMAVWSLQHDLSTVPVSVMVGLTTPVGAQQALTSLLSTTSRWEVGTVTVTTVAGASMYRTLVWNGLATLISVWGGEVDAEITVDGTKVTSRAVSLWSHQGSSEATRRFDYGADLVGIKRRVESDPFACRIIPLGKGEESEGGGYGRKITIESVNDGKDYLQNDDVVAYVRVPTENGYEYPTIYAENPEIETPLELKAWGESVLEELTSPRVSYEADVLQLSQAGMDVYGIALGDLVHCVDRKFSPEGLRVAGRVTGIDANLLDPSDTQVTIGYLSKSLSAAMQESLAQLDSRIDATIASTEGAAELTDAYVARIISRLNEEANLTGGYFYYVVGQGVRTYDTAVSDPTVGSEASQVVEIKGGNIRIANSRTSSGDWDWKTVIVSGHLAIDLVTAARLVAGYIGSPSGNYWNLDTGDFQLAATATLGGRTVTQMQSDISGASSAASAAQQAVTDLSTQQAIFDLLTDNGVIQGLYMSNGQLYVNASYIQSGTLRLGGANNGNGTLVVYDASGTQIGKMDNTGLDIAGALTLLYVVTAGERWIDAKLDIATSLPFETTDSSAMYGLSIEHHYGYHGGIVTGLYLMTQMYQKSYIGANGTLLIQNNLSNSNYKNYVSLSTNTATVMASTTDDTKYADMTVDASGQASFGAYNGSRSTTFQVVYSGVTVQGSFYVTGTKSRVAKTSYGKRLLYCDEAASPLFTDVGSGTIGEDGLCYVEIDDIFSEAARTDLSYQVFLQKCGRGDLWVAEKHHNYFVVEGTPSLPFDWQLKARQRDYENDRIEDYGLNDTIAEDDPISIASEPMSAYDDDMRYAELLESIYADELA